MKIETYSGKYDEQIVPLILNIQNNEAKINLSLQEQPDLLDIYRSYQKDGGNRRVFNEESVNWMQGIKCLKCCGASIEDIRECCRLCLLEESEENLRARYEIILKRREEAYKRVEEAKAAAKYMDGKVAHYKAILAGLAPDDTNPKNWTAENRPKH